MQLDPKKMIEAMTQVMVCMYNTQKGVSQKSASMKPTWVKPYLGKSKPSEIAKGLDSMTNPSLMCHYCIDTGHKLDNCRKLQQKIQREQLAAESIIPENVLNEKHLKEESDRGTES